MERTSISSPDFESTDNLFELIQTKLHLLTEMRSLSIAQTDLISQHDATVLMGVLSKKQQLMDSLQDVQERLVPFQNQLPDSRRWSSQEKRTLCQALSSRCDTLLSELIVMENRSLDNMVVQRELVSAQLQQNANASLVQHAYQANKADEQVFADSAFSAEG